MFMIIPKIIHPDTDDKLRFEYQIPTLKLNWFE